MSNKLTSITLTPSASTKMKSLEIDEATLERELMYAQRHAAINPKIMDCDPDSIAFSVLDAISMGITLNPINQYAYLEPRWDSKLNKSICHFRPMFRGLAFMAINEGAAIDFDAQVVYANDTFTAEPSHPTMPVKHIVPSFNRGEVVGVYVVAYLPSGRAIVELIDKAESDKILKTSQSPAAKSYPNEFRRKSALKRIIKRIAFGSHESKLHAAIDLDNQDYTIVETPKQIDSGLPSLTKTHEAWGACVKAIQGDYTIADIRRKYNVAESVETELLAAASEQELAQ